MLSYLLALALVQDIQPVVEPERADPPSAPVAPFPGRPSSSPLLVETPPKEVPAHKKGGCAGPGFDDFDFLAGSWDVYNANEEGETLFGTMDIEWVNGGCALLQRWTARNDYSLVSAFYFDPNIRSWRKETVIPDKGKAEMVGEAVDDTMVLAGVWRVQGLFQERTYLLRDIYAPKSDGTISLRSQSSNDRGLTWEDSADQTYRPRE